jgi:tRNA-dihydrouridine synthase
MKNNMLDYRFSVAPMMDWTDRAEKAKYDQHLNGVVVSRAVPNAVPRRRRAAFD